MKRKITFFVALLFFVFGIRLEVFASGYVDEMSTIENTSSKNYSNLTPQLATGVWATLPDKNFFAMQNATVGRASVTYRVQNANQVTVNTVSASGTAVGRNELGEYVLGSANGEAQTGLQVKYSPSNISAFITAEGGTKELRYDRRKGYIFAESATTPSDGVPYGVAVWVSSNGLNYQLASQGRTQSSYYSSAQLYYESWTANIPSNATYLKIEINDVSYINSLTGGESMPKIPTTMTMLARAEIQGTGLIIGVPEPIKTESEITTSPESSEASQSSAESEAKKAASSKPKTSTAAPAAGAAGSKTTSSKEGSASEKFEGEITAGGGITSRASAAKKSTEPAEEEAAAASPESVEEKPEQQVYYMEKGETEKDGFSKGIVVYIMGISALILFVLLRPKGKK